MLFYYMLRGINLIMNLFPSADYHTNKNNHPNGWSFLLCLLDTINAILLKAEWNRFAYFFLLTRRKYICSHQFLNWWQQMSTGHLHFWSFASPGDHKNIPPLRVGYFYGGAEGQPVLTTKLSKDYIYSFRGDSSLLGWCVFTVWCVYVITIFLLVFSEIPRYQCTDYFLRFPPYYHSPP